MFFDRVLSGSHTDNLSARWFLLRFPDFSTSALDYKQKNHATISFPFNHFFSLILFTFFFHQNYTSCKWLHNSHHWSFTVSSNLIPRFLSSHPFPMSTVEKWSHHLPSNPVGNWLMVGQAVVNVAGEMIGGSGSGQCSGRNDRLGTWQHQSPLWPRRARLAPSIGSVFVMRGKKWLVVCVH